MKWNKRKPGEEEKRMAKFSVGIEEDGEGPSNRVPKRQRFNRMLDVEGDREGEESEEEEEEEEEESGAEQGTIIPQTTTDASISISFTLTDPEVLDCSICYEPLAIPVFQVGLFYFIFYFFIIGNQLKSLEF